jgi:futalosine hydrolase
VLLELGALGSGLAGAELCGFGPIAAAARAAQLIARFRPERVLLAGIAGAYDLDRAPIGTAVDFDAVALDGVGAGEGDRFSPASAIGFPSWQPEPSETPRAIAERIDLPGRDGSRLLLTVCACSDGEAMAARRRARFPQVLGEDMEGFAVAAACALSDVPLRIVRGISNAVGDRRRGSWRFEEALSAAHQAAAAVLETWT